MKVKKLIIHHSAVSRDDNKEQFNAVRRYHKGKGWGEIGYHYFIDVNGTLNEGRLESETGAHTKGMNNESLGICLAGNFDKESPNPAQIFRLRDLLRGLVKKYKLKRADIEPHNKYANKTCPGKNVDIEFIRGLIVEVKEEPNIKKEILKTMETLTELVNKL